MKILIFQNRELAVNATVRMMLSVVQANPNAVLGLATGSTMEPVYRALRNDPGKPSFQNVTSFNLDEYVGLAPNHPQSYRHYMNNQLFDHIDIDLDNTHIPRGDAENATAEARAFDQKITESGGIDFQLLGLGANGHIGFNEPGSSLGSRTRVKTLTQKTRADNARLFAKDETVPKYAITMGIDTIMDAKSIVLLATGANKAKAAAEMIEGPVSARCPASVLQFHPHVTVALDSVSAEHLELKQYYNTVHPNGQEADLD